MSRELGIQAIYLASSVLFILGLKSLTRPAHARRGMQQAGCHRLRFLSGRDHDGLETSDDFVVIANQSGCFRGEIAR